MCKNDNNIADLINLAKEIYEPESKRKQKIIYWLLAINVLLVTVIGISVFTYLKNPQDVYIGQDNIDSNQNHIENDTKKG